MKFNRKWAISALIAICVIAGAALWSASGKPAVEYATAAVTVGDLQQTVLAVGRLRAKELVAVGAQVSGQVQRLHVVLGQQVKAGDLIAEVDAQPQRIALRNAEASVNALQAQLAARRAALVQAQLTFKRQQELLTADATSRADHEAAKAALDTAHAEIDSLQAQIEQARTQVETNRINLGYTRIVAPMDGVIVAVVTKQGQTLNSFQSTPTIVMLARLDVMTLRAEIAEADVDKVQAGQTVWFTTLGNRRQRHEARIRQIEPAPESIVNDAGGAGAVAATTATTKAIYYNALFDVPNPDGRLRPSMTAQVSVQIAMARQAVLMPAAALGERVADDTYVVRVMDGRGQVSQRQVRIGLRTNAQAQVLAGLNAGEQVVIGEAQAGAGGGDTSLLGF
ncbi:efflux RND transporter periplasmic adaptor subunit [Herbaspirillum seropedicae]|uniref:efflux RND transporter periplasmic adaptor subunit n=1 Tax=Herbaspirillum seropedicae TaxID=964 RepID=UPI00286716C0|nr:efflux RND transporter periplasmic adaptor subunit [Herbaspirillum seropedicae]MDR6397508.1 macrolide-specific efflux system membrane fusion protein [Herbaspirillum seropedicae]